MHGRSYYTGCFRGDRNTRETVSTATESPRGENLIPWVWSLSALSGTELCEAGSHRSTQ